MEEKYREMVPEVGEMEKIINRRKDPRERRKVITFYEGVIQSINNELDGVSQIGPEDTAEVLLQQLITELRSSGTYGEYEAMEETRRRQELLIVLFDRCKARIDKVIHLHSVLLSYEKGFQILDHKKGRSAG